jgi:lipoprotein-anchoring transpeptidase ErfK/SrfK
MRWVLAVAACAALALAAVRTVGATPGDNGSTAGAPRLDVGAMTSLATTRPAFRVPTPRPLSPDAHDAVWAALSGPATARRAPRAGAAAVARLPATTPEGTTTIVLVLRRRVADDGSVWNLVSLPVLPNGSTGWLPRRALNGYTFVDTRLWVDLAARRLVLTRSGRVVFRAPVGVGAPGTPTPTGRFYIRDRLTRYASPFYGPIAFGTSARSAVLTDWPAGGYIGIHGTNRPGLIPGAVSHGCIRLRNDAIRRLAALMPVGTPVTITRHGGPT